MPADWLAGVSDGAGGGGWGLNVKSAAVSVTIGMADGTTGATKCADTDPSVEKETEAKMCGQILPTLGKLKYPEK